MKLRETEIAIAQLLRDLENDTGHLVHELSITDVDVTSLTDDRQQLQRRVVIDLRRNPGSNWSTK